MELPLAWTLTTKKSEVLLLGDRAYNVQETDLNNKNQTIR